MNISKFFHCSVVSPLLIVLVIMASCAPAPETASVIPSATIVMATASQTLTSVPTATLVPTETATPFVPKATIKIASQSPLSIQFVDLGTDIMRGADLAVRQLANPLIELGYKVELKSYDDQNDFGVAADVAKQIVADPEILCIVGPFTSRVLNQVKEIYHQAGLPFISPSATAAFAVASGYPEVNRVVGRNDGEGAAGGQFAKSQDFARVFIISQNTDPARFIAKNFRNEASRLGVTVVGDMSTDAVENFDWLINRVLSNNADLVYFSTLSVEQAGTFFREARALGYMGALMGPSSLDTPSLLDLAGPLLVEGNGMYYTTVAVPANDYPDGASFTEDFETLYGESPHLYAPQAYDAAGICMKAIEEASKARDGENPTRAEVAKSIRALQDYKGITGVYNFNKNGDPSPAQYFVFQVVSADPEDWDRNTLVNSYEVLPPE